MLWCLTIALAGPSLIGEWRIDKVTVNNVTQPWEEYSKMHAKASLHDCHVVEKRIFINAPSEGAVANLWTFQDKLSCSTGAFGKWTQTQDSTITVQLAETAELTTVTVPSNVSKSRVWRLARDKKHLGAAAQWSGPWAQASPEKQSWAIVTESPNSIQLTGDDLTWHLIRQKSS